VLEEGPGAREWRAGVEHNFALLAGAVQRLGGLPAMLDAADCCAPGGPHQHAVAGCACNLIVCFIPLCGLFLAPMHRQGACMQPGAAVGHDRRSALTCGRAESVVADRSGQPCDSVHLGEGQIDLVGAPGM
jgi:hypothetical protein